MSAEQVTLFVNRIAPGADPACRAMAEAVVKCAIDITHECGDVDATNDAIWATILEGIDALHSAASTGCVTLAPHVAPCSGTCDRLHVEQQR